MNKFLSGISNWGSHRPLLWLALENTKGAVLEMGMGPNSTPFLHDYCTMNNRFLGSYENVPEYLSCGESNKYHHSTLVTDWDDLTMPPMGCSVLFIDHAPAERRHVDAIRFKDLCEIMVVHDAEHEGKDYDVYEIAKITEHFKYRLDHAIPGMPAKTIMLSNTIDVSKLTIPSFTTV